MDMPRPRKNSSDLLSLLSPDRRRAILAEALGAHVRSIFGRHQRSSLGALVEALRRDARWGAIQTIAVSSVLKPSARGAAPAPEAATRGRRRGRRGRLDQATLDQILRVVSRSPGMRSEQIQKALPFERTLVKAGLAKLRELKKVKTNGIKRATTYAAA
jgi:hypothetical protein